MVSFPKSSFTFLVKMHTPMLNNINADELSAQFFLKWRGPGLHQSISTMNLRENVSSPW